MGYYIVYCLIVILLCGIFIPDGIDGKIDNVPLLIFLISILFITLIIKAILYIRPFIKAKKHLIQNGYTIQHFSISPMCKSHHIVASKGDKAIKIFVLNVTRAYLTYHFDTINKLELYKSTRLAIKPRVGQANIISDHVDTKMIGSKKLHWQNSDFENATCIVLFNKLPSVVKDSTSRTALGNGDIICNKAILYDIKGFVRHSLKELL